MAMAACRIFSRDVLPLPLGPKENVCIAIHFKF